MSLGVPLNSHMPAVVTRAAVVGAAYSIFSNNKEASMVSSAAAPLPACALQRASAAQLCTRTGTSADAAPTASSQVTQRVWKQTALPPTPPTPSSPSPTCSPPSSRKQRRVAQRMRPRSLEPSVRGVACTWRARQHVAWFR